MDCVENHRLDGWIRGEFHHYFSPQCNSLPWSVMSGDPPSRGMTATGMGSHFYKSVSTAVSGMSL